MIKWVTKSAGGTIYSHLQECLSDLQSNSSNAFEFTCNEISIVVYKNSCIEDLCDKFDYKRIINYNKIGG
jgi:hypothetical protein